MRIEIINGDDILYPITNCYCVTGYKNYNVKQILDSLEQSSYQCDITSKRAFRCYRDNLYQIDISDYIPNVYNNSYNLFVYLNGSLLYENKDYNLLTNKCIFLKKPTRVNDMFIFEVISKNKYANDYNKHSGCNIMEKIHINNIFNRINTYCNTIKR